MCCELSYDRLSYECLALWRVLCGLTHMRWSLEIESSWAFSGLQSSFATLLKILQRPNHIADEQISDSFSPLMLRLTSPKPQTLARHDFKIALSLCAQTYQLGSHKEGCSNSPHFLLLHTVKIQSVEEEMLICIFVHCTLYCVLSIHVPTEVTTHSGWIWHKSYR